MLFDPAQQTTALFVSEGAASRAARLVERGYPQRVRKATPQPHLHRGEMLGYKVLIDFLDNRPSSPLTNSDFERLA